MKKLLLCSLVGLIAYNLGKGIAYAYAYDYYNGGWYE